MPLEFVNQFPLTASPGNLQGWKRFDCNGPRILCPNRNFTYSKPGIFLYSPDKPPTESDFQAEVAEGSGPTIFLHGPGTWFLKYTGSTDVVLDVFDATGSNYAETMMTRRGWQVVTQSGGFMLLPANVETQIFPANPRRKWVTCYLSSANFPGQVVIIGINGSSAAGFQGDVMENMDGSRKWELYGDKLALGPITGFSYATDSLITFFEGSN